MLSNLLGTRTSAFTSRLFDEKSFYSSFLSDMERSSHEVIIESPFISSSRMRVLMPYFRRLMRRGVRAHIITRDPSILDAPLSMYSEQAIQEFEALGVQVYATANQHHRKIAIVDRQVLWEGSLNILSQSNSREIMRRIDGKQHAEEMFEFLKLGKFVN
ncbi:MAG: phospholipase D-like domain-containing protein [Patescibacteria group bacterium]